MTAKSVAVKVLVINGKRVLLTFEKAKPEIRKPSMWGLPGGHMDPGDRNWIMTGEREVAEETGIVVEIDPIIKREVEVAFEGYTKIYVLGRPVGGQLKGETAETYRSAWVPKWVFYDLGWRNDCCPEGIYSSHVSMAKELLQDLDEQGRNSLPVLAALTEGEIIEAVRTRKPVCLKNVGRIYSGTVTEKRGEIWFKGQHRTETIVIRAGSGMLFRKERRRKV